MMQINKDLERCKKFLESNRFKGLVPIIAMMTREWYYRLTEMKSRTSESVLNLLKQTEMSYKIHETGVFHDLNTNLKKWVELLKVDQ